MLRFTINFSNSGLRRASTLGCLLLAAAPSYAQLYNKLNGRYPSTSTTKTNTAPAFASIYETSTIAGTPNSAGYSGDGGLASAAQLSGPLVLTFDSQGNYYISDYTNYVIRQVNKAGIIKTIAGSNSFGFSGDGGPATSAQVSGVQGMVVDPSGRIYISDTDNARVRLIDTSGNITTIAGTGTRGYSGDYGPATSAQLFFPTGLALDKAGNLYIADYGNTTVRKVTPAGVITTVAGIGVAGFAAYLGSDGGLATSAVLGLPYSVAVDPTGNLYIADIGSGSIRKVGLDGHINNIVTGVAGAGLVSDSQGNIYYADFRAGTVNRLTPSGVVTDFAGNGLRGFRGDGGASQFSEFDGAYSAAFDSAGNFYVADFGNDAIRLLSPLPSSTLLVANGASNVANQGIAPGEVVTLSGINLGPSSYSSATADANGIFEGQLNGTTVTFNGIAAPMLVASATQIVAIAPYEISGLSSATVAVRYNGVQLLSTTVAVTDAEPEIFTSGSSGISLPPLNNDGSINSQTNAAAETSTITFFVTGEGQLKPSTPDGQVTVSGAAPVPVETVSVLMNGATATVVSATEAVGLPAGVLVVSATIPSAITTTSAMSVVVTVGSHTSLPAYVAVQ